jgi:hypothetical protein
MGSLKVKSVRNRGWAHNPKVPSSNLGPATRKGTEECLFSFKTWRNQEQDLGTGGYEHYKRGKFSDFADPFLQPADMPIFLASMNAKIDYLVLKNWGNL